MMMKFRVILIVFLSFSKTQAEKSGNELGSSCKRAADCSTLFAECVDGTCSCAPGFEAGDDGCSAPNYSCPFGEVIKDETGSVQKCYQSKPRQREGNGCGENAFCQRYGPGSKTGHCCPIPESSTGCPVGSPHINMTCTATEPGSEQNYCNAKTHFCSQVAFDMQYVSSQCCPTPCNQLDYFAKDGNCYAKAKVGEDCVHPKQCYKNADCKSGKCECITGYLDVEGFCYIPQCPGQKSFAGDPKRCKSDAECAGKGFCNTAYNVCCEQKDIAAGSDKPDGIAAGAIGPVDDHPKPTKQLGETCSTSDECKPGFTKCLDNTCHCLGVFKQTGNICEPPSYSCPTGNPVMDGDRPLVCTRQSKQGSTDKFEDSCPDGAYCQLYANRKNGLGHCCPAPNGRCPAGEPDPDSNCIGNIKCDDETSFCYGWNIGNGLVSGSLCCRKACRTGTEEFEGSCIRRPAKGKCEINDHCQAFQECNNGVCKCKGGMCGTKAQNLPRAVSTEEQEDDDKSEISSKADEDNADQERRR